MLRIVMVAGCALAASVVLADNLPTHKPGLWEITGGENRPNVPPTVQHVCLDPATEQLLYKVGAGASQKMCPKVDVQSKGGQIVVDTECNIGNSKVTGHSVTVFSGDSAYHTVVTSHFDPPLFGRADSTSARDGKWLSACPAGMKPGDVEVSGGRLPQPMKMNLNDMLNRAQ